MLPNKKYAITDFITLARKYALLLIMPMCLGVFLALVVSSQLKNLYQAETLIQIVPQRVPDTIVQSTVTVKTEDRLDALKQQVQSRTQLERMITELNLYPEERATRPMQDVVETMRSSMSLQPVRPSGAEGVEAFYLRFLYRDPVMAARVTERMSALYIDYNARERGTLAQGTNQFLLTQMNDAKARLEQQERKLQQFRERHAGSLPDQQQYNMQAIQSAQLQRQALVESLARDRDRKLMLERLYNDAVAEPAPVPVMQVPTGSPGALAAMSPAQQLELARRTLAQLSTKLKEGHPDLRRARKQVTDLEAQVASMPASTGTDPAPSAAVSAEETRRRERISGYRAEIEGLTRGIGFKESEDIRLGGVIADYQRRIEAVPGLQSEWLSLSREYEAVQASYKEFSTKSEAARVSVDLETRQVGEQFRVLDPPRVPGRPVSPQRQINNAGGAAGGLFLGLLIIALLEIRDGSLKTDADVEHVLKLPVIAVVPLLLTDRDRSRRRLRRQLAVGVMTGVFAVGAYVFWAMRLWKFVA
jgi:uncharacterized protein involved in exopolysaccharide biosynthesis